MILSILAEKKVLEFKLDTIRNYINSRLSTISDPIVSNELKSILSLIGKYETVPPNWELSTPIVDSDIKEGEIVYDDEEK